MTLRIERDTQGRVTWAKGEMMEYQPGEDPRPVLVRGVRGWGWRSIDDLRRLVAEGVELLAAIDGESPDPPDPDPPAAAPSDDVVEPLALAAGVLGAARAVLTMSGLRVAAPGDVIIPADVIARGHTTRVARDPETGWLATSSHRVTNVTEWAEGHATPQAAVDDLARRVKGGEA